MAFDGITIHALTNELNNALLGGRINKIAQTEKDELMLTIKSGSTQYRLLLSVNASLPLAYLTDNNKPSPMTAPGFCMLLRKYLASGRIISITQPGLERIIDICIEHLDEMGDVCIKHIMVELMGKYSNIIFTDNNSKIIDSIKRINASVSSVREVLPGFPYFIPKTLDKKDPLLLSSAEIFAVLKASSYPASKAIYSFFTGISPQIAEALCFQCDITSECPISELSEDELLHLSKSFYNLIDDVKNKNYTPCILTDNGKPVDFTVIMPVSYGTITIDYYDSVSNMLETYYFQKNAFSRIHQRSADLRQVVNSLLQRNYKKYELQEKQLTATEKRNKYKIYGELLKAYCYNIKDGSESYEALNYYDNTTVKIPLDKDLTVQENIQKYFSRYNKLKRTYEAQSKLIIETQNEINHLESISTAIDIAVTYDDLTQIKEELVQFAYIKRNMNDKKNRPVPSKSKPFHYISSDGYDIFVGKNNLQNEELTFKIATGNDWWFHAKGIPGSHVIVKCNNEEIPDRTFEEAARLAAHYSKGSTQEKVEIDYIQKKNVKKSNGSAPGFVIYHTNYSMIISPDIIGIKEV